MARGPQHFNMTNGNVAAVNRQNLDGATPELRAKLQKRLEHLHGGAPKQPKEEISPATTASSKLEEEEPPGIVDELEEEEEEEEEGASSAESEPIEYAMLSVAPRLSSQESAQIFDKVRRKDHQHMRLQQELQRKNDECPATPARGQEDGSREEVAPAVSLERASTKDSVRSACEAEDMAESPCEDAASSCVEREAERCVDDARPRRCSCLVRLFSWLWLPLLAMCVGVGLAQQENQEWRTGVSLALQQLLPQYAPARPEDCREGQCSSVAGGDDIEGRLQRSREFSQARSRTLDRLARTIVFGVGGAGMAGLLLVLSCSGCVARVLVVLFLATAVLALTLFAADLTSKT